MPYPRKTQHDGHARLQQAWPNNLAVIVFTVPTAARSGITATGRSAAAAAARAVAAVMTRVARAGYCGCRAVVGMAGAVAIIAWRAGSWSTWYTGPKGASIEIWEGVVS